MMFIDPPRLQQSFNRFLLTTPMPIFRETSKDLKRILTFIEHRLWKKLGSCPGKQKKCEELKSQFMELYERAKTKEKELEAKTEHHTQRPFYSIGSIGEKDEKVFRRLTYRSCSYRFSKFRENYEISEI